VAGQILTVHASVGEVDTGDVQCKAEVDAPPRLRMFVRVHTRSGTQAFLLDAVVSETCVKANTGSL